MFLCWLKKLFLWARKIVRSKKVMFALHVTSLSWTSGTTYDS